jgi:integrase
MAAKKQDKRKLEKTTTAGIYRRHADGCKRSGRCHCSYVVRWKAQGQGHNRLFPTFELAREFKGSMSSGKVSRKPASSETVAGYYEGWIENYRGRTVRGVQKATLREYGISFEHHILELPIARTKLRDLTPAEVKEWFVDLERRNASPATIKRARIALRVMLACAVEDNEITSNAAADARYIPTEATRAKHARPEPRRLVDTDVNAILRAMPDEWRAFFVLLAQTGVRIGELLGLTWQHVHLGDDAHVVIAEQVYRGERKRLKTDYSTRPVKLSQAMAVWLSQLRPEGVAPDVPVFASSVGTPIVYANVYNRVLRPALIAAGIAKQVGTRTVRKGGRDVEVPVWDYQRVGMHAFRHYSATTLHEKGLTLAQMRARLGHGQLTTTMGYTHVGDEQGDAELFDDLLDIEGLRVHPGSTGHPETAANDDPADCGETASQSQTDEQPQTAARP